MISIQTRIITAVLLLTMFVSCSNNNQETPKDSKEEATSMKEADDSKKFEGIQFATLTDTICGMPLKAGIADTLVHDGKIYGFCATECKQEFAKVLKEQR